MCLLTLDAKKMVTQLIEYLMYKHKKVYCISIGEHTVTIQHILPFVAILSISPTAGNVLGSTPVVVSGPCLQDPTDIQCIFGDQSTRGEYLTDREAYLCTSPELQRIGRIPFTLVVRHGNGNVYRGYTSFQSGEMCNTVHRIL